MTEKEKYNYIHTEKIVYGWRTVRLKPFQEDENIFYRTVDKIFKKNKIAIDVGCGKGRFYNYFSRKYKAKITGIDISEVAVFACKQRGLNCIVGEADNIPFSDNSFDLSYHLDGMEHIPTEIELKVLEEQCRVSKKYIIHNICRHQIEYSEKEKYLEEIPLHINLKSHEEWISFFEKNSERLKYKILVCEDIYRHTAVILEKI